MEQVGSAKHKRRMAILILIGLAIVTVAVCLSIGAPMLKLASEPEAFRQWLAQRKVGAPLIYMGMVLLQTIIAVIPGEPLEIAGGFAFGALQGTILCLLAEALGGAIIFVLVRRFGTRLVELFFSKEKLHSIRFLKNSPKRTILFLIIFMIPGTPKDLLCYFAGLTELRFPAFLLIASLGRIPSVITSTLGGSALGTQQYLFAGIVFIVTFGVSLIGLLIYKRICDKHNAAAKPEPNGEQQDPLI